MTPIALLKQKAKELFTAEHELIDSIEVVLTRDSKYGWDDGKRMGMYDPFKKRITLYDVFQDTVHPEYAIDSIFPTYAHELVHAMQHQECGTILYLLVLGLFRWKLEKDAQEIENRFYPNGL